MKKVLLLFSIGWLIHLPLISESEIMRRADQDGTVHLSNLFPEQKRGSQKAARRNKKKSKWASIQETIKYYSDHYGVEPELVAALIKAESDFRPNAVSSAGAMGLMQLMPATAAHYGVSNPFDPEENIRGGVMYLRYLLDRFDGDMKLALAAFNSGETTVTRYKRVPPFTKHYVKKVIKLYNETKGLNEDKIYSYLGPDGTMVFTNLSQF